MASVPPLEAPPPAVFLAAAHAIVATIATTIAETAAATPFALPVVPRFVPADGPAAPVAPAPAATNDNTSTPLLEVYNFDDLQFDSEEPLSVSEYEEDGWETESDNDLSGSGASLNHSDYVVGVHEPGTAPLISSTHTQLQGSESEYSLEVLTESPRIATADYPDSPISTRANTLASTDSDSLPTYSAAIANRWTMNPFAQVPLLQPLPILTMPEAHRLSSRQLYPPSDISSDISTEEAEAFAGVEVQMELDSGFAVASLSLGYASSSSYDDSTCSSTSSETDSASGDVFGQEDEDGEDDDEDDDDDDVDDDDDDDENSGGYSGGPGSVSFDDSIDGDSSYDSDHDQSAVSTSEADSDQKYKVLLSTIANLGPEDIPSAGESDSSSDSDTSSGDNGHYRVPLPGHRRDVLYADTSSSSSSDFYELDSLVSSEILASLDTNLREQLGITIDEVPDVGNTNSSEERLDSSLSQFNETGSRGSALGSLHLGRDLWSELSRSPLPPSTPSTLVEECIDTVKGFRWKTVPSAPFPKPRMTFSPALKQQCEHGVKVPIPVDLPPPLPLPKPLEVSVSLDENISQVNLEYFPSTILDCLDSQHEGSLIIGSFRNSHSKAQIWSSMEQVLDGNYENRSVTIQLENHFDVSKEELLMSEFFTELSEYGNSDPGTDVGMFSQSHRHRYNDQFVDDRLLKRFEQFSMASAGVTFEHEEEVAVSPHSVYAQMSSTVFSSENYSPHSPGPTPTPDTSPQEFFPTDDDKLKSPLLCRTAYSEEVSWSDIPASLMLFEDMSSAFPDISPKTYNSSGEARSIATSASSAQVSQNYIHTSSVTSCSSGEFEEEDELSSSDDTPSRTNRTVSFDVPLPFDFGSSDVSSSIRVVGERVVSNDISSTTASHSGAAGSSLSHSASPRVSERRGVSLHSPTMVSPESIIEAEGPVVPSVASTRSAVVGASAVVDISEAFTVRKVFQYPVISPAPFPSVRTSLPGVVSIVPYQQPTVPFVPSTVSRKEIAAMATDLQSELSSYFDTPKQFKGKMMLGESAGAASGPQRSSTSNVTDENVMFTSLRSAGVDGLDHVEDSPLLNSGSASTRSSRRSRLLKSAMSDGDGTVRLLATLKERVKRSFKSESKLRKGEFDLISMAGVGYKSPTWKSPSWKNKSPSFKSPSTKSPSNTTDSIKRHTISKLFSRSRDASLRGGRVV